LFEDFDSLEVPEEPAIYWGVGSRGAWVSCEDDPLSSSPADYAYRPRRMNVLDSNFREIRSLRFQEKTPGEFLALDADGLHLSALRPVQGVAVAHENAIALVRGCTFEACEYRSVKLQLARAIVEKNSFIRTTNGHVEVDAQWSGMELLENTFEVRGSVGVFGGGLVAATVRDSTSDASSFRANRFLLDPSASVWAVVGISSQNSVPIRNVVVNGNNVVGRPKTFCNVLYLPVVSGSGNAVTVTWNSIDGCEDQFIDFYDPSPGAVLKALVTGNTSTTACTQRTSAMLEFDCWSCNAGIYGSAGPR
jgi:hypothetical protein